ncbi:hypothetical protein GCM10028791_27230 [Echinicola sediminis]
MKYLKCALTAIVLGLSIKNGNAQVARNLETSSTVMENKPANTEELQEAFFELSQQPGLTSRGTPKVYKGKYLEAIQFPVGGIGTGNIQFDGHAVPRYWQIFNNMTHDFVPNSFFAVREKGENGVKVRALQTQDAGVFQKMKSLEAVSAFPFLKYRFKDELSASISMEVFNPFIPTDLKNSGIPTVFYRFTIENPTEEEIEISLLASQQNAVGYSKVKNITEGDSFAARFQKSIAREVAVGNRSSLYGGNVNTTISNEGYSALLMSGPYREAEEHYGQMALMLFDDNGSAAAGQVTAQYDNAQKLLEDFTDDGLIKVKNKTRPSAKGQTYSGAINVPVKLKAHEKKVINMALVWYFPNGKNGGHLVSWDAWGHGDWEGLGNYYAQQWKRFDELLEYITTNYRDLVSETESFTQSFYETNLPYWLVERMGNQLNILHSRTIFHDKNNYVGLWEGAGAGDGSCAGNCNHVWHYAQAHARLFPGLARQIRKQTFEHIKEGGQIPYRQPAGGEAFDGQCGDILGAYREHLLSEDSQWLQDHYGEIKMALNYLVNKYDADKDGWLSDAPKHTTYDASMTGNPSYLTSLYHATLLAGAKMAQVVKDVDQGLEWEQLAERSIRHQEERLWNGQYYYQVPGVKRATDYENGCHSDQLLGQWWADQIGLGSLYSDYRISTATKAVLKNNFKANLKNHVQKARKFAMEEEPGMVVTTWPENDRTPYASGYSDEVWPTFEYTIGSSLIKYGDFKEALTLLKAGDLRYDGQLREGYLTDNGWGNFGFSGNPFGDDECGQFYSRSLSIWSVLLAAQGFTYDGPQHSIGFDPKWQPDGHASFFSTAKGWGLFTQNRESGEQVNTLELKFGELKLYEISLNVAGLEAESVLLSLNGKELQPTKITKGEDIRIEMEQVLLQKGDVLTVFVK